MDAGTLTLVLAALVVVAGLVALLVRGQMAGRAKLGDAELELKAVRRPKPPPGVGSATIENSWAEGGDATAIGPGGARITGTRAGRNLYARGDLSDTGESNLEAP